MKGTPVERRETSRRWKKIIGVDAGCLGINDDRLKVGVYRVAYNLLAELGKIDKKNTYRLYSFYPIKQKVMASFGGRMKNIVLRPQKGWFTLRLPLELKIRPVDIFLGFSQALPYSSSHNILFVYDLAFEPYPELYPDSYQKLTKNTKKALKLADKIIAVSQSTKKDLMRFYGVPGSKIGVCHPGIGPNFSPDGKKFKLDAPYFLFVGSLKKKKNIPRILKGFSNLLLKTKKEFKLVLVGGDLWFDSEIAKAIKELGLKKQVLMTGFVKDEDLPQFYRGAVVFVSPSLYEGFGITHLEAMACGTPVIAGNISSMPEIVGDAGILVNPKSEKEIGEAMLRITADKRRRQDLVKRGLKRAKRFSWKKFARKIWETIDDF